MSTKKQSNLTPIMFTDIVGYSSMVAKDEKGALKLLDEHNELIFPIIKSNDGEVIKLIGDAIFARFKSSEGAINTAIEIQSKLKQRNSISSRNERIQIRIGLHTGEMIQDGEEFFGFDVNLCSRLESITQSGSITISDTIYNDIQDEKELFHRQIGHVKLKNIPEPKILYKIYLDLLEYNNESEKELIDSFLNRGINIVDMEKYKQESAVSLGVLYFTNLGDDTHDYYCYNFTKDLIDYLQSVNTLRIPSINEISKYKNEDYPLSDIARMLAVDKLIHGSILVDDDIATIKLELIDTNIGSSLWETEINVALSKTINSHNEIIDKILTILDIDMPENLKKKFTIKTTENPDADKEYKKARYLLDLQKTKEDLSKAEEHLDKAIKHDSKFIYAHAQRGVIAFKLGEFEKSEEILNFALEIAEQDKSKISNAYVYAILGQLYILWSKNSQALKYNKKALEVYKYLEDTANEAIVIHNLATTLLHIGEEMDALKYYKKSLEIMRKSEDRLSQGLSYGQMGNVYLSLFDYSESIHYLNRSLSIFKDVGQYFNEGMVILFIIEPLIETGQFNEASELIIEAENILNEYQDSTINGRLYYYKGMLEFYKSNIVEAVDKLENSIEEYQVAQKNIASFKGSLFLIEIHIFNKKFSMAQKIIEKIETQVKQIKDNMLLLKYESLLYLINVTNDNINDEGLRVIVEKISNEKEQIEYYFSWWYLAIASLLANNEDKAKEFLLKSQNLLKEKSKRDSDESYYDILLNSNPINKQINTQSADSFKEFADSLISKSEKIEVSKFCGECGYSNVEMKPFCPECGNKLKML